MNMANQPPETTWHVTSQSQVREISAAGTSVDGFRVYFQTGMGNEGSVFIPMAQYTEDNIKRIVGQQAAAMDAVSGLSG